MRTAVALAASAFLAACSFWSERPLFDESRGVTPFADVTVFAWREDGGGGEQEVVYRRVGKGYEVRSGVVDARPMGVVFIEVPQTPEEDYIVQVSFPGEANGRAYAFMWRTDQGHRFIAGPQAFESGSPRRQMIGAICAAQPNGECRLDRRQDVLDVYLNVVHSAFIAGGETPEDFIDQVPIAPALEGK